MADSGTLCYVGNLALGEVLMEEPGQLLWQDTVPAGQHKKYNKEKPRASQGKVSTGIHLAQVRVDQTGPVHITHWQI